MEDRFIPAPTLQQSTAGVMELDCIQIALCSYKLDVIHEVCMGVTQTSLVSADALIKD